MKSWKNIVFWSLVFLITPWILILAATQFWALFLTPSGAGVIATLEAIRDWSGLKVFGITLSVLLLLFGKDFTAFYIKTRSQKPEGVSDEQFEVSSIKAVNQLHWFLVVAVALNLFYIIFV